MAVSGAPPPAPAPPGPADVPGLEEVLGIGKGVVPVTAPGAIVVEEEPVALGLDDGLEEEEAAAWRAAAWAVRNFVRIVVNSVKVSMASGERVGGMWVAIFCWKGGGSVVRVVCFSGSVGDVRADGVVFGFEFSGYVWVRFDGGGYNLFGALRVNWARDWVVAVVKEALTMLVKVAVVVVVVVTSQKRGGEGSYDRERRRRRRRRDGCGCGR